MTDHYNSLISLHSETLPCVTSIKKKKNCFMAQNMIFPGECSCTPKNNVYSGMFHKYHLGLGGS